MKKITILLTAIILIMAGVTVAVLTSVKQVTTMEADGYAVSGSATVKQSLVKGENKVQTMEKVAAGDIIYSSALGYYVGTNRISMDKNYPVYMNEGATLRFLDDANWLVTDQLEVLQTYNGLYLNEGYTYNAGMEQADAEEFILLALNNGLHINAQKAVVRMTGTVVEIPVNSVIRFAQDSIRWYYFGGSYLAYDEMSVSSLDDVSITIGDNTWYYLNFLKDLDLIREITKTVSPHPGQGPETEPTTIPTGEGGADPTAKKIETPGKDEPETQAPAVTSGLDDEEVFYLSELGDVDRKSTYSGLDELDYQESASDIPAANRDSEQEEPNDITDYDRVATESGDDIPSTDRSSTSSPGKKPASGGGGGSTKPYETPAISLVNYEPWVYAFAAKLNYTDNSVALTTPVAVAVYENILLDDGVTERDVTVTKDSQGNLVYPYSTNFNGYVPGNKLKQQNFYGASEFALASFKPGSKVYVQYSYTYYTDNRYTEKKTFVSDFTEIQLLPFTETALAPVKASWTVPTKTIEIMPKSMVLQNVRLENMSGYQEPATFNFKEYQNNTLQFVDKLVFDLEILQPQLEDKDPEKKPSVTMSGTALYNAKKTSSGYVSNSALRSDAVYRYTVYAEDEYGNKIPLMICENGATSAVSYKTFSGKVTTRRTAPGASLKFEKLEHSSASAKVTLINDGLVSARMYLYEGMFALPKELKGKENGTYYFYKKADSSSAVTEKKVRAVSIQNKTAADTDAVSIIFEDKDYCFVELPEDGSLSRGDYIGPQSAADNTKIEEQRILNPYVIPKAFKLSDGSGNFYFNKKKLGSKVTTRIDAVAYGSGKTHRDSTALIIYEDDSYCYVWLPEDGSLQEKDVIYSLDEKESFILSDRDYVPIVMNGTIGGDPIKSGTVELNLPVSGTDPKIYLALVLNGLKTNRKYMIGIEETFHADNSYTNAEEQGELTTQRVLLQSFTTARDAQDYDSPMVSLENVEFRTDGSISLKAKISVSDKKSTILNGVKVTAYDDIQERSEPLTDIGKGTATIVAGKDSKDWKKYVGNHKLSSDFRDISSADGAEVSLSGLVPGSDLYLQVTYDSIYLDGTQQKTETVYSNFAVLEVPSAPYQLDTVKVSWDPVFAAYENGIRLDNIRMKSAKDAGATVDSLECLLDKLQLTLVPITSSGSNIELEMGRRVIQNAKSATAAESYYEVKYSTVIQSDTVYRYSVRGIRANGMNVPLQITAEGKTVSSGESIGYLYTRKKEPIVRMKTGRNADGKVTLTFTTDDQDSAVLQDQSKGDKLIFSLYDSKGNQVLLNGTFDDEPVSAAQIDFVNTDKHVLVLTGLTVGEEYTASVIGGYDLQPSAKASEPSQLIRKNQELIPETYRKFTCQKGKEPTASMKVIDTWAYAVALDLQVSDPSQIIDDNGIVITVTDAQGKVLATKKSKGTQQLAIYPLEPGKTVYLKYKYSYYDSVAQETKTVTSKVISAKLPTIEEAQVSVIMGQWEEIFAYSDSRVAFDNFYLKNSTDYDKNLKGFNFANFKKNPLRFLDSIEVVFTPVGAGERKTITIGNDMIARAASGDDIWEVRQIISRVGTLLSNSKYTYTISAKDQFGNTMPFEMSTNGIDFTDQSRFKGAVYTAKKTPSVLVREAVNEIGDMEIRVEVTDTDGALTGERPLTFCISDKNGRIRMHGDLEKDENTTFWQSTVTLGGKTEYLIRIDNLELGFNYTAQVYGTYDPQPDCQVRESGKDLPIVFDELLGTLEFKAKGTELVKPTGGGSSEGEDPEEIQEGLYVAYWPPEVTTSNYRDWAYAVGVHVNIDDPTATIQGNVAMTVWDEIIGNEEYKIVDGHKVYSAYTDDGTKVANKGQKLLLRKGVYETSDVALGTLKPDNTVYVQYTYTYVKVITTVYTEEGTRKKTVVSDTSQTESVTSDITEVVLHDVDYYSIDPIAGSWTDKYAEYDDHFGFDELKLRNSANYDPLAETFSWDNFRKNTIAYLNNVEIILKEEGNPRAKEISVMLGNSAVAKAISLEDGTSFEATDAGLEADKVYTYTAKAYDSYGNVIPFVVDANKKGQVSYKDFTGKIYTRKAKPDVEINMTENDNYGKVEFKITVRNPQRSLDTGNLEFFIVDGATKTNYAVLDYNLRIGEDDPKGTDHYNQQTALLPFDKDQAEAVYYLRIESLDFETGYYAAVTGTYLPQPSAPVPEGQTALQPEKDTMLLPGDGYYEFSTSRIADGVISFSMVTAELGSDYATLNFTMKNSTQSIVDILNQIKIVVTGPDGTVTETIVKKSELALVDLTPGTVMEYEVKDVADTSKVVIKVEKAREGDSNYWQAIMGRTKDGIYQTPGIISVTVPRDTTLSPLRSKTKYSVKISALISRPNGTTAPTTELDNNEFWTNKKMPAFLSESPFIAGSVISLLNSRVYDPDGAITGHATATIVDQTLGGVTVYSAYVDKTATGDGNFSELLYENLVSTHEYTMSVRANVAISATSQKEKTEVLYSKNFTVGDNISAELKLESINSYLGIQNKTERWIYLTPNTVDAEGTVIYGTVHERRIKAGWANEYTTELFPLEDTRTVVDPESGMEEEETVYPKAVSIDMPMPSTGYIRIRYYNSKRQEISGSTQYTYKGTTVFVVPQTTKPAYFRLEFSSSSASFEKTGINIGYYESAEPITWSMSEVEGYKTEIKNRKINALTGLPTDVSASGWSMVYMVPVTPGDTFVLRDDWDASTTGGTGAHVYYYTKAVSAKGEVSYKLVGKEDLTRKANYLLTVPEGASYLSYDFNISTLTEWRKMYRIGKGDSQVSTEVRYSAKVQVNVQDKNGYLKSINEVIRKTGDAPNATIRLWSSGSTRQTSWDFYKEKKVTLVRDEATAYGWYYSDLEEELLATLEPDRSWKLDVVVERYTGTVGDKPQFQSIVLKEITFQTDGPYELIHNRQEMRKIYRNPYGNFLVVEDFVNNETLDNLSLYGTIDFQGHIVTSSSETYLFTFVEQSGRLSNLVYDVPENLNVKAHRPIVKENYGTVDNVMIRTLGTVYHYPENYDYSFLVYYNYGTISNFVMQLGGDLHMDRRVKASVGSPSFLVYCNLGIIENWYMGSLNGARLIVGNQEDGEEYGYIQPCLIRHQYGIVRNFYLNFETDIVYPTQTGSITYYDFNNLEYSDLIANGYHSGDFNLLNAAGVRSTPETDRLLWDNDNGNTNARGSIQNLWHITNRTYKKNTKRITYASTENLRNVEWQESVLGERFTTEPMALGYFPQLKLNECMKAYQGYQLLPGSTLTDVPEYISSESVEDEYHRTTATSGYIRLMFNNSYDNIKITGVNITGLTVDEIESQGRNSDGIWEVILRVHVDESNGGQYLSAYTFESFTYNAGSVPVLVGRSTSGVEFWKLIETQEDWANIGLHMGWNYRLNGDITFRGYNENMIQIRVSNGKNTSFTGKIDGNGHTISNIVISGTSGITGTLYPNVIYRLGKGAEIRNLTVDNLTIKGQLYSTDTYCGFIGAATGAKIDGLHVKNSHITAVGFVGGLVGQMDTYSSMYNCSSINNQIDDGYTDAETGEKYALNADNESYYGGLFGYSSYSITLSSFTRNLNMQINNCTNIQGAGGLVGRAQGSTISDCYATGLIKGTANNVGGAIGNFRQNQYVHLESIWTSVTLDILGDYVGGFAGRVYGTGKGIFSAGNIYCTGVHLHRGIGYSYYSRTKSTLTSYVAQNVSGLTSNDPDDSYYVLSSKDLESYSVWADKVLLDGNWDVIAERMTDCTYFPKVYKYPETYKTVTEEVTDPVTQETTQVTKTVRALVDNQDGEENSVYLPGKGGQHSLEVETALYDASNNYYLVQATLTAPNTDASVFDDTLPLKEKRKLVDVDGLTLDNATYSKIKFDSKTASDGTTAVIGIQIEVGGNAEWKEAFTKALDLYRLTVTYSDRASMPYTQMADIGFIDSKDLTTRIINYWDIDTVQKWYDRMEAHGKTNENFRLLKMLNFGSEEGEIYKDDDKYRNLRINRLVSNANAFGSGAIGISNMVYETNSDGDPWISNVATLIENIAFINVTGNMDNSAITVANPRTGVIFSVRDINKCLFKKIRTNLNSYTLSNSAFIMIGYGNVTDTTVEEVIYDTSQITTRYSYAAGFMCHLMGSADNISASKIYVNAPNAAYVGGLFCMLNSSNQASQSLISEVSITNNNVWGGEFMVDTDHDGTEELTESTVRGENYVGYFASHSYENMSGNTIGKASTDTENNRYNVESQFRAGGFVYYHYPRVLDQTAGPGSKKNKVTNGQVMTTSGGGTYCGGMYGWAGYAHADDYEDEADGMTVIGNGYVGGLYGGTDYTRLYNCSVVNTTVKSLTTADELVDSYQGYGGVVGNQGSYTSILGASVRNTSVSGPRNVGGITGRCCPYNNYEISRCYVAEDVTVSATNQDTGAAGGIVGYGTVVKLYYNACGASVNATGNYAGGLVGLLYQIVDSAPVISNCYFCGNVTAKNYVGGVIGFNRNYVSYTVVIDGKAVAKYARCGFRYNGTQTNNPSGKDRTAAVNGYYKRGIMNGVVVAGTFNTTVTGAGEVQISAWYNSYKDTTQPEEEGDPVMADDPRLVIWTQCTLNGVPVDTSETNRYQHSHWASSQMLREKETYTLTSLGNLGTTYFDYDFKEESETESSVLKLYMPYVKYHYSGTNTILKYANYKSYVTVTTPAEGDTPASTALKGVERAGIKLPDYGANPTAIQVYASGADTVNIEVTETPEVTETWDEDYQQVEYIQTDGNGNQWLTTGYSAKSEYVRYEFQWMETTLEKSTSLFGSTGTSGSSKWSSVAYHNDTGSIYTATGSSNGMLTTKGLEAGKVYTGIIKTYSYEEKGKMKNGVSFEIRKPDGTLLKDPVPSAAYSGSVMNGTSIGIFCDYFANGGAKEISKNVRLYSWKMYETDADGTNERLVCNMVPCYRIEDHISGMYDTVAGKFHVNQGSGLDFILGAETNAAKQKAAAVTVPKQGVALHVKMGGKLFEGAQYVTDKDGILTLNYDFNCDIEVSQDSVNWVRYSADELRRTVAVTANKDFHDFWYYFGTDNGGNKIVNYGTEASEKPAYELPKEYTRLKYIKNTKDGRFSTDLYGESRIQYKLVSTGSGRGLSGLTTSYGAYWGIRDGKYENWGNVTSVAASTDENNPDTVVYDFHPSGYANLIVNGKLINTSGTNSMTNPGSYRQWMFGFSGYNMLACIYEAKIWQKGKLVAWFIPVKKKKSDTSEDYIYGMYDVIRKQFFSSEATAFTGGPAATDPIPTVGVSSTGTLTLKDVGGSSYEPLNVWNVMSGDTPETQILGINPDSPDKEVRVFKIKASMDGTDAKAEIASYGQEVANGTIVYSRPFLSQTLTVQGGTSVNYDVYKNSTVVGIEGHVPSRIYLDGSMVYTVSPWQELVYDKVIIDDRTAENGSQYLAVLSSNGTITANFSCDGLNTVNIREINNSFHEKDPYLVVLYRNGSVRVFNYVTGTMLHKAESNAGFKGYLESVFGSMGYSVTGGSGLSTASEGGNTGLAGSALGGGLALLSYDNIAVPGLTLTSGVLNKEGTALAAGTGAVEDGTGEGNGLGEGLEEAIGTDEDSDPEEYKDLTVATAVYIPGEGILASDGTKVASEEETEYVPGEGVYVNGELAYEESIYHENEELALMTARTYREEEEAAGKAEKENKEEASAVTGTTESGEEQKAVEEVTAGTDKNVEGNAEIKAGGTAGGGTGSGGGTATGDRTGSTVNASGGNGEGNGEENVSISSGNGSSEEGAGTDADGTADGKQSGTKTETKTPVLLVTQAEKKRQITEAVGKNVHIMNTVSGEMEEYDSRALYDGELLSAKEKEEHEKAELLLEEAEENGSILAEIRKPDAEEKAAAAGAFVAAGGLGRTLEGTGGNGFRLILLMAIAVLTVLGIVYYINLQKKRRMIKERTAEGRKKEENR